jgi:hypothetical protein
MNIRLALALAACLQCSAAFAGVKGEWHTDPNEALAVARKLRRPVLAVAMDHG